MADREDLTFAEKVPPGGRRRGSVGSPDFEPFGLARAEWIRKRDLDFFHYGRDSGVEDESIYGLWLCHRPHEPKTGVRVGTFQKSKAARWTNLRRESDGGESAVALHAVGSLVDLTRPDPSGPAALDPRMAVVSARLREFARQQALSVASWQNVNWTINGEPVSDARVLHFAGGWAAIANPDLEDLVVVAVGVGVRPQGLVLEQVNSGVPYGFSLESSLSKADIPLQGREWRETLISRVNPETFHSEHLALLSQP